MPLYQLKTIVHDEKVDEFVRSLRTLWVEFLKEEGCLGYRVYQDFEKQSSFCLIGEFDTHEAMADHFQTHNFEVLLGATRVLGQSFKLVIADVLKKGGYELVESKLRAATV